MMRDLVSGYEGAEYESEAEERVRWLFIEMRKSAPLRCGPAPKTLPIKLQFMNTASKSVSGSQFMLQNSVACFLHIL